MNGFTDFAPSWESPQFKLVGLNAPALALPNLAALGFASNAASIVDQVRLTFMTLLIALQKIALIVALAAAAVFFGR
ncbi:MAG: hypothetical protein ACRCT6_02170 [Notoacmeibacter sp.]